MRTADCHSVLWRVCSACLSVVYNQVLPPAGWDLYTDEEGDVHAWMAKKMLPCEEGPMNVLVAWQTWNKFTKKWDRRGEVTEQEFCTWMQQGFGRNTAKFLEKEVGNLKNAEQELHRALLTQYKLRKEAEELQASRDTARDACTGQATKITEQARTIKDLQQKCAALEAQSTNPDLEQKCADLKARAFEAEQCAAKLRTACHNKNHVIAEDAAKLEDYEKKIQYLEREVDSLMKNWAAAREKANSSKRTLDDRDRRIKELEDKFEHSTRALALQTEHNQRLQNRKRKADKDLAEFSFKAHKVLNDIGKMTKIPFDDRSCSPSPPTSSYQQTEAGHAAVADVV